VHVRACTRGGIMIIIICIINIIICMMMIIICIMCIIFCTHMYRQVCVGGAHAHVCVGGARVRVCVEGRVCVWRGARVCVRAQARVRARASSSRCAPRWIRVVHIRVSALVCCVRVKVCARVCVFQCARAG